LSDFRSRFNKKIKAALIKVAWFRQLTQRTF